MIKKSWTTLILASLFMLIFCVSIVSAESPDAVIQKESPSPQSQMSLADIFTAFSEVNTALERKSKIIKISLMIIRMGVRLRA